jgi:putative Holliday junction resolvase
MGIDYGTKRIGIALSDEGGKYAMPKAIIMNSGTLMSEIKKIVDENDVGSVVVGESKNYKGEENIVMGQVRIFAKALGDVLQIPIYFHPEILSSAEAERTQGKTPMLDASAAAIILQDYLVKYTHPQRSDLQGGQEK